MKKKAKSTYEEFIENNEQKALLDKEYQELLKENVDVKLHKIKLEDVPSSITAVQMNGIIEVVEE